MTTIFQPGDRCGDHEILHHLATGDHAEVYAAVGPNGEPRAIKLVATDAHLTAKVHARLAQEGVALTLIVHPGVVRFHGAGIWEDRVWLSLELVLGDTLRERLRAAGGRVPLDVALYWMAQACDGLAEGHRVGVVHRNLTPDNVIVGPDDTVKVVDFGLAKLLGHGFKTTKDQAIGSEMYMSPEQTLAAPGAPAMDVYASAVILYEMIAGFHPMGAGKHGLIDVIRWHQAGQPPRLRALVPWVPSDVDALVHQGLEKDPARRPTMRAFTDGARDALSRRRAPERREARNVPLPNRDAAQAPTAPMAVYSGPAIEEVAVVRCARGGTIPMAIPTERASAPAGVRSTDVPVESSVRRSTASPRRARGAALGVGAVTVTVAVAATGWTLFGRVSDPASGTPPAPGPVASAAPSAAPPPSPVAIASASAAPAVPMPPKPAGAGVPARTPPRRTPAARPPPAAKNRLFGTEG